MIISKKSLGRNDQRKQEPRCEARYDWLQIRSLDESKSIIQELALAHARKGGEQGERIANYIVSGDLLALCNFSVDYETSTPWESSNCRQALAFYTKSKFFELRGVDREAAAFDTWKGAERLCQETNAFFEAYESGLLSIDPEVAAVLHRATRKISMVLGDVPSFKDMGYRFGPGATTLTKKSDASVVEKLQAGLSCSEELAPYVSYVLRELPHLRVLHNVDDVVEFGRVPSGVIVENDRMSFVLKNLKTYRTVTTGSTLTMMCQLALGDEMGRRLAKFGIDLKDQTLNQEWAQVGSIDGSVATVDLKTASDSVATRLIYHTFPVAWATALDACRSSKIEYNGEVIKMEKFASMGNGFTMPLQSLLFWALASCCADDDYAAVYGDDIIVSTSAIPLLQKVFRTCGFVVNTDKSYWAGSFRESCGADYHRGIDIRPFYLKNQVSDSDLFQLHNFYARRGNEEMRLRVKAYIDPRGCIYGPDNYGDGHLIGDWTPHVTRSMRENGHGGATFKSYKQVGVRDKRANRPGDHLLSLYSIYRRAAGDGYTEELDYSLDREIAARDAYLLKHYFDDVGSQEGVIAYLRIHRFDVFRYAPVEMPERVSPVNGEVFKTPSYPGFNGYKKVSIYTFAQP